MATKKAIVKNISLPPTKRTLVISDIHGNLPFLQGLLQKINLTTEDTLIFLGDMIEKGEFSLETLRYIQALQQTHNVHLISGNYEAHILKFFEEKNANKNFLDIYLKYNKHSILFQMAQEANITPTKDLLSLQKSLRNSHEDIYHWLKSLPTILDSEKYLFVHGGIPHLHNLTELDSWLCMKHDYFLHEYHTFSKYVVVGHTPSTLYHYSIPNSNPIIDNVQKIISIDGACVLKKDGQLNALILQNDHISWDYFDDLPLAKVKQAQEPTPIPLNIRWGHANVNIIEKQEEFTLCYHIESQTTLPILSSFLNTDVHGNPNCHDSTNYHLPLQSGEIISLSEKVNGGFLGKKNGITGWYFGEYEEL